VTISPDALPATAGVRSEGSIDVDRAIVVDLHDRRGGELYGFARHLGLSDEEARDAVQESLLRLWAAIDAGQAIGQRDAWVFRTLHRVCMDQHRWRRRVRGLVERIGPPAPRHEDQATRIALWEAVEQLPQRQRAAVYLRYRADLPFDEIGEVLGIAPVSARSHVSRALDTLRAKLADPEVNR
jgi:RNA polymerase sigma factor (sigma-70 family)